MSKPRQPDRRSSRPPDRAGGHRRWPHGEYNHIEIPDDDEERAKRFYAGVFGWQFRQMQGFDGYDLYTAGPGELGGGARQARRVGRRDDVRELHRGRLDRRRRGEDRRSSAARSRAARRRSPAWAGSRSAPTARATSSRSTRRCPASPLQLDTRRVGDNPPVRLVDSHCHLQADRFDADVDAGDRARRGWRASSGSSSRAGTPSRRPARAGARRPVSRGSTPRSASIRTTPSGSTTQAWAGDRGAGAATRGSSRSGRRASTTTGVFSPIPAQLANLRRNLAPRRRDRQAGDPPLPVGGRPARRAGRAARRDAGRSAATPPPVARSTRSAARSTTREAMLDLGAAISFSGLAFRRGRGGDRRGRPSRAGRTGSSSRPTRRSSRRRARRAAATSRSGSGSRPPGSPSCAASDRDALGDQLVANYDSIVRRTAPR